MIEHAVHLLPAQGPINVFVHHNTLHAFEDLSFVDALAVGSRIFGNEPYLSEDRYRQRLARQRIRVHDLTIVLREDLGDRADESVAGLSSRFDLRMAMLIHPLRMGPRSELRWFMLETDALERFRSAAPAEIQTTMVEETRHWVLRDLRDSGSIQEPWWSDLFTNVCASQLDDWSNLRWESFTLKALWRICSEGMSRLALTPASPTQRRPRDLLLEATGLDADLAVHELLIRFCAAFLDQGVAHWELPGREQGFLHAFTTVYGEPNTVTQAWQQSLPSELMSLRDRRLTAFDSIRESLADLGVSEDGQAFVIEQSLLALRGWAGMIHQMTERADRVAHPLPAGTLPEFLAVRLLLDRLSLRHLAREGLGYQGPLASLADACEPLLPERCLFDERQRSFLVFQLAQVLGWTPARLSKMSQPQWLTLIEEVEAFSSLERRRVYQAAFERRYRMQTLDALLARNQRAAATPRSPVFQIVTCIDDREESLRRHVEEIDPEVETFGAAGFFSVAMYYQGAAEARYVPLCPVVIRPQHYVREVIASEHESSHQRRATRRRLIGMATHHVQTGSRRFALGILLTGLFGPLASIPLVVRVLFPRFAGRVRRLVGRLVQPPADTQLHLERYQATPSADPAGIGFTVEEMASIVERLLRDIGLTSRFSRMVILCGHGSASLNNPHEAAYHCGACGGNRGGPNARAFAQMANDPRIRAILLDRGLAIPETTCFVGAYHNTCDDAVGYFDEDLVPATHEKDFAHVKRVLQEARLRNAQERCRRFGSAPLGLSAEACLRHVESRAEDISQTRPEYNHATNAACVVARRSRTRGLFMDRRSFLVSYDPTQDDDDSAILTRILQAVVPVCSGINLEYYFSTVDVVGWGCGSKLPHNITGLFGVMEGSASDLRPGLNQQMIEIHEPMRLVFVVETTPARMQRILDRQPYLQMLFRNEWVFLTLLDPESATIHQLRDGQFVAHRPEEVTLPSVRTSRDWFKGWRDHLGFALVDRVDRRPETNGQSVSPTAGGMA
jgi:uncharacterized protein YbcC (UPF0753/DUF2309 family)